MRADRIPFSSGDEQDVLSGWRKVYCWTQRAGATAKVKRRYRRRVRRHLNNELDGRLGGWADPDHDVMADMRLWLDLYDTRPRKDPE